MQLHCLAERVFVIRLRQLCELLLDDTPKHHVDVGLPFLLRDARLQPAHHAQPHDFEGRVLVVIGQP